MKEEVDNAAALEEIVEEMVEFTRVSADLNAINLFLLAQVQKELKQFHEARQNFGRALLKMPLFRSAWLELLQLLGAQEKYHLEQ